MTHFHIHTHTHTHTHTHLQWGGEREKDILLWLNINKITESEADPFSSWLEIGVFSFITEHAFSKYTFQYFFAPYICLEASTSCKHCRLGTCFEEHSEITETTSETMRDSGNSSIPHLLH